MSKLWTCMFCMTRNHFPKAYAENISETNLPAELIPQFVTCEYELPVNPYGPEGGVVSPPAFLFVVDVCMHKEELAELADSIQQVLNLLPPDALVGLITYGTNVNVYEVGFEGCPKSFVLRGDKEYDTGRVSELLGIHRGPAAAMAAMNGQAAPGAKPMPQLNHAIGSFLVKVSEGSFMLENMLEDLQKDPWPVPNDKRTARCTGVALSVAMGLMDAAYAKKGGRIMLFTSGPCTSGPGAIVSRAKTQDMRCHADLAQNKAPMHAKACEYYEKLSIRATGIDPNAKNPPKISVTVGAAHVVDIFACSLDQVGMLEMKGLVEATGGVMVLGDSFGQSVFKESFKRVFRRWPADKAYDQNEMVMGFSATVEVMTSREYKISGAIGPCSSLRKVSSNVSDIVVGTGGTNLWSLGGVNPNTTLAFYFDVANAASSSATQGKRRFLQFITRYQHANGRMRVRTTTLCGPWHSDPNDISPIKQSFDQEAAAILTARLAVHRTESEDVADVLMWVDRSLIRLAAKFADYRPDDPSSFRLPPAFGIYPQFIFHLRRSPFLQLFNSSPDEASYYRYILTGENTANSLVMIQPTLLSFSFNGPPEPALLDAQSVRPDAILLLDTFFHVVVFHGETIAAWREMKYHEQEEHASFRDLLEMPQEDAQIIMDSRFPVPRYIVCDQHKSEARFLMAKLNPSVTHHNAEGAVGAQVFTDDVSLRVFMEHLMKLAVQS